MIRYINLLLIICLSIHTVYAKDITPEVGGLQKLPTESQVKKTDQIIAELSTRIKKHNLAGSLIIGGGIAYDSINYQNNKANDIDGMFIFPSRALLKKYLKTHSASDLKKTFGFDDGFVYFNNEELNTFLDENIPVLRVAGNINNVKVTVKLTDYDSLSNIDLDKPFQVLSKLKDRRIYQGISLMGDHVNILLVNKSLLANQNRAYIILDKNYYRYKETLVPGLITDFLITAKAINDYKGQFSDIQLKNRNKYVALTSEKGCLAKNETILQHLVREPRFSDKYKENLQGIFKSLIESRNYKIKSCTSQPELTGYLVAIDATLFKNRSVDFHYQEPKIAVLPRYPENVKEAISSAMVKVIGSNQKVTIIPLTAEEKIYSSNPELGKIYLEPVQSDSMPTYFYKLMREKDPFSILYESNGLLNLKQLYRHIVEPVYLDPTYRFCIEPFFEGKPLALYFKNDFEKNATFIENVELRRAEEILTGYVNSLEVATKKSTLNQRIHKLYYDRLVGERIHAYYDNKTLKLPSGEMIHYDELKTLTPIINGIKYPSLGETIEQAKHNLNPSFLNTKLKIYGFGDNHAGNVLVKDNGEYVTIDYEYAGIAHPCLDLAKSIYNNIYFDILFPDVAASNYRIDIELNRKDHQLIIHHNFTLSEAKKALLSIHMKGILEPFFEIAQQKNYDATDWQAILGSALFAAGFLNKNIFEYPNERGFLAYAVLLQIANP